MAHRGIITGLFAEYSDDHRRIVLLNPTVLFVDALVCVGGCREVIFKCVRVSAGVTDAVLNLYELKAISRAQHVVGL